MQKKIATTLSGNALFNELIFWLHIFFGFFRNTALALLLPVGQTFLSFGRLWCGKSLLTVFLISSFSVTAIVSLALFRCSRKSL
jgi:hypothetical protein